MTSPYTAVLSCTARATWKPGQATLYEDSDRNAQPARSPINYPDPGPTPTTTGCFATDRELAFLRPVAPGERLGQRGRTLLSCSVKRTSSDVEPSMTFESEIVSDSGDVVARVRTGVYAYNPHPDATTESRHICISQGLAASTGRYCRDVADGEQLPTVTFALPLYRLVVAAGANRDFKSIHHNADFARGTGAPGHLRHRSTSPRNVGAHHPRLVSAPVNITSVKGFRMQRFTLIAEPRP